MIGEREGERLVLLFHRSVYDTRYVRAISKHHENGTY